MTEQRNLQSLKIPSGFKIIKNEFYVYDPTIEFNETDSLAYLQEDLLQIVFEPSQIVIDLGWYGDISKNDGHFKIYVILDRNCDKPIFEETASSANAIKSMLEKIILAVSIGEIK